MGVILAGALGLRLVSWQAARGFAIRGDEPDYVIPAETFSRTGRYLDTFLTEGRTWTRVPLNGLLLAVAFSTQPPVPPGTPITETGLMARRFATGNLALIAVSLALLPPLMALAAEAFPARRRRAALLTGIGAAAYPPLINSAAEQLLSETLFLTLAFVALWTLTRWQPRRSAWPWLVNTGLLLGLAALARPVVVSFLPFLALWLFQVGSGGPQHAIQSRALAHNTQHVSRFIPAILRTLVVTAALFMAIAPWTVYNYRVYGRLLILDTANITAFWHYNNYTGQNENEQIEQLPNPADRQTLILRAGLVNILGHPDRFARTMLDSLSYAWHLELQSAVLPNAWDLTLRDADVPAVLPGDLAFLWVSLAGLGGMVGLGQRQPTDQAGRVRRALLLWIVCVLALGAIVPYDARYRLPAAPALIVFAAGLVASADWQRIADPRRWASVLRAHPAVAGITALLGAWVLVGAAAPSIPPALRALALAWQADGADPVRAAALNAAAIAALPASPWPYRHAAEAARHARQDDTARQLYAAALARGDEPRSILGLSDLVYRHPEWRLSVDEQDWLQPDPNDLRGPVWNSFAPMPQTRVVLGAPGDWSYQQGFHRAERSGATPFRWSGGRGEVRIPATAGAPAARGIRLRLAAPPIGPPGPWPVTIRVDGAAPVRLDLTTTWTDYTVQLKPPVVGPIRLHLDSPVRRPNDYDPASPDRRLLGAGVQWVEVSD